jgi:hypothetical protein
MMWRRFWPLFLLGVLFSALVIFSVHAEETQNLIPSAPNTTSEFPQATPPWTSFDTILTELGAEAIGLSEDSKALLISLAESRTEAEELRSSLKRSDQRLLSYEAERMQEREAADKALTAFQIRAEKAERHRDMWMAGALALAGVSAILTGFLVATF